MKKSLSIFIIICAVCCLFVSCEEEHSHTHAYFMVDKGIIKCTGCQEELTGNVVSLAEKKGNGWLLKDPKPLTQAFESDATGPFVIRSEEGSKIVVDTPNADVHFYGKAESIDIKAVKSESAHIFADVKNVVIQKGHLIAEETSKVNQLKVSGETKAEVKTTTPVKSIVIEEGTVKLAERVEVKAIEMKAGTVEVAEGTKVEGISMEAGKVEIAKGSEVASIIIAEGAKDNVEVIVENVEATRIPEIKVGEEITTPSDIIKTNTPTDIPFSSVAKIGNAYYSSLKNAIEQAKSGDTIEVLLNLTEKASNFVLNKALTLDLNGKTINVTRTDSSGRNFEIQNSVTIKNGTITGSFPVDDKTYGLIYVEETGHLTVEGLTINISTKNTVGKSHAGIGVFPDYAKPENGTLVINSGTFNCAIMTNGSNGTDNLDACGSITFNGGTFNDRLYLPAYMTYTFNGGTFNKPVEVKSGVVSITGGSFNNTGDEQSFVEQQDISISGCSFGAVAHNGSKPGENYGPTPEITITGGTFAGKIGLARVDASFDYPKVTIDNNVNVEVIELGLFSEAKIGTKCYMKLQDAINAAQEGDTVVLCSDVTPDLSATSYWGYKYYSIAVEGKNNVTIDLNGYTLNGALMIGGHVKSTIQSSAPSGQNASWEASTPSTGIVLTDTSKGKTGSIVYGGTEGTSGNCINVYDDSDLTINGGNYYSAYEGLEKTDGTLATSGQPNVVYVRGGNLTINDGKFESKDTKGGYYRLIRFWEYTPATVTVNGGTFNANGGYACVFYSGSNSNKVVTVNINGGIYTTNNTVSYLADIYGTVNEKTSSFTFNKAGYKYNSNVIVNSIN